MSPMADPSRFQCTASGVLCLAKKNEMPSDASSSSTTTKKFYPPQDEMERMLAERTLEARDDDLFINL